MTPMRKIALIVEPDFMRDHVGVRSYIYSLRGMFGEFSQVDLVSFYKSSSGVRHWFRLEPTSETLVRDNGRCSETCYVGSPAEVLAEYRRHRHSQQPVTLDDFFFSHIGSDLAVEDYDLGVITAPWCVTFEDRLPCKKLACIVYDLVPNQYAITKSNPGIQMFASRHSVGFQYYRRHCDFVLAISGDAAREYHQFYGRGATDVVSLPPLIPNAYFATQTCDATRPSNVALAAPFDPRKGLHQMPELINAAAADIRELLIYGGLRCSQDDLHRFFSELQIERVSWWPSATADRVIDIFNRSRVLLFPSNHEGLGLPILESQFYGCRALVRDRAPMNTLLGPGSRRLNGDAEADGAILTEMLRDEPDCQELQRWAIENYSPALVRDTIYAACLRCDEAALTTLQTNAPQNVRSGLKNRGSTALNRVA